MKKLFLFLLIAAFAFSYTTKANGIVNTNTSLVANKSPQKDFTQNWSVSSYGFLIFPIGADLEEYLTYIKSKTHSEAQEYLSSISFTSLGTSLYGSAYADQSITDAQAINYVLNTSRIFQIHGIVIKPLTESTTCEDVKWKFVLAMSVSNLNSGSYYNFSRGIYDGNVMNKYATNPPASDTLSLVQKMSQSDAGYEATDPNPCPTTQADKRPFWGWSQYSCVANECFNPPTNSYMTCYFYTPPQYYVFWILVNNNGGGYALQPGASCPPID